MIKFRGKRKDDDKWIYGSYVYRGAGVFPLIDHYLATTHQANYVRSEVFPDTVGQCVGLNDKNGVIGWCGDIYHLDDFTDEYEIRWDNSAARFYLYGIQSYQYKDIRMISTGVLIGNVHDTPPHRGKGGWLDDGECPGYCPVCGKFWQWVRPGKSQPQCRCDDKKESEREK